VGGQEAAQRAEKELIEMADNFMLDLHQWIQNQKDTINRYGDDVKKYFDHEFARGFRKNIAEFKAEINERFQIESDENSTAFEEIEEVVTERLKIMEHKVRELKENQQIPPAFDDMDRELTNVIRRLGGLEQALERHLLEPQHPLQQPPPPPPPSSHPSHSPAACEAAKWVWEQLEGVKKELTPVLNAFQGGSGELANSLFKTQNFCMTLLQEVEKLKKERNDLQENVRAFHKDYLEFKEKNSGAVPRAPASVTAGRANAAASPPRAARAAREPAQASPAPRRASSGSGSRPRASRAAPMPTAQPHLTDFFQRAGNESPPRKFGWRKKDQTPVSSREVSPEPPTIRKAMTKKNRLPVQNPPPVTIPVQAPPAQKKKDARDEIFVIEFDDDEDQQDTQPVNRKNNPRTMGVWDPGAVVMQNHGGTRVSAITTGGETMR
jgi:hypothetical protein